MMGDSLKASERDSWAQTSPPAQGGNGSGSSVAPALSGTSKPSALRPAAHGLVWVLTAEAALPPKLSAALVKAQGGVASASEDKQNTHTRRGYASRESIAATAKAALKAAGLAFFARSTHDRGGVLECRYALVHESGEAILVESEIPMGAARGMSPEQVRGSAETYGYKYALLSILNIPRGDEDPDEGQQPGKADQRGEKAPGKKDPAFASAPKSHKARERFDELRAALTDEEFAALAGQGVGYIPKTLKEAKSVIRDMEHNAGVVAKLEGLLRNHDWFWQQANGDAHNRGRNNSDAIRKTMEKLPEYQAKRIYERWRDRDS